MCFDWYIGRVTTETPTVYFTDEAGTKCPELCVTRNYVYLPALMTGQTYSDSDRP